MRGMAKKGKPRGMTGRRPTGIRAGEKVSEYRQFTVRLPDDVRAELEAAAGALKRPGWRVVIDAIRAYVGLGPALTDEERRAVRIVLRLHDQRER
jgi:hypothetical protein